MRRNFPLLLGPAAFTLVLLSPPPGLSPEGATVLATAMLMAIWWMTEAVPIPATALFPLAVFPLAGVAPAGDVSAAYMDPNIVLFMGGFFLAMAIQKWNLHRRVALWIIYSLGASPRRLVLGFMVATAALSMWVSNTATAMMMLPIGTAVIIRLQENGLSDQSKFPVVLMLAIAYSASIGGVTTLIGTPPNIVFASQFSHLFPDRAPITFLRWAAIGLPFTLIFLPLSWIYLTRIYARVETDSLAGSRDFLLKELSRLGPMHRGEKRVAIVFLLTALAWIFRTDISLGALTLPGWASLAGVSEYVHDSAVAMVSALVLFCTPADWRRQEFLLDWDWAKRIPWGILILFGGGIALANGFQSSGLASWVADFLQWFRGAPVLFLIVLTCGMLTFLTELTSNTATATIFMPIMAATAATLGAPPEILMIPATISASCAFMLPVATPPNAIVFGSEYVTIPQMAKAGFLMNVLGILVTTLVVSTAGALFFGGL